jgi:hypothetical protein
MSQKHGVRGAPTSGHDPVQPVSHDHESADRHHENRLSHFSRHYLLMAGVMVGDRPSRTAAGFNFSGV